MLITIHREKYLSTGVLLCCLFSVVIYAKEEGVIGRTLKNRKGCTCHNEFPSADVLVSISGPDTLQVGSSALYTATISSHSTKAAGINIATSDGELFPISGDLKKLKGELTHTSPKYSSSGKVIFQFSYSAPKIAGEQYLFASGNIANMNGKKTGDSWSHAPTKKITIVN
jgi:hypothetical protein